MNNEVRKLLENLKKIVSANALEAELIACASDEMCEVDTVEDLNNYLEESMTYWEG